METNLFVKSFKAVDNKITDIKFYGDWELELGTGPEAVDDLVNRLDEANQTIARLQITINDKNYEIQGLNTEITNKQNQISYLFLA